MVTKEQKKKKKRAPNKSNAQRNPHLWCYPLETQQKTQEISSPFRYASASNRFLVKDAVNLRT